MHLKRWNALCIAALINIKYFLYYTADSITFYTFAMNLKITFNYFYMVKYNTIIYFRGKCYKNTIYNRLVARILTFSYRLKCLLTSLFVVLCFITTSCVSSSAKIGSTFYTDSLYTDSFGCNGHSYIRFRVPHSTDFQIIHNPDCFCRYNRTFVVIKKNK